MTQHLFMACLSTETNTFAPMPTGLQAYKDYYYREGTATQEPATLMTESLHIWRDEAQARGWRVSEGLTAIAEPAGLTPKAVYEGLRDRIKRDLAAAGEPSLILLQLHGAMVAQGYEDCEADLVAHIRDLCPHAFIGVALDLHCHLTQALLDRCDAVITMKEYPHDDVGDRARDLFQIAAETLAGRLRPTMALFDCHMIDLYLTKTAPMAQFVERMRQVESEPGIASVSLGHGFPWADVSAVGARLLVVADGDARLASETAARLGQEFYALRHDLRRAYPDLTEGLDRAAETTETPVTLADMSDNPGAGAPGDSTFVLRAVLARKMHDVALGLIWDPMAVAACCQAGQGARLTLRLGGKTEAASGDPIDVQGQVVQIASGLVQHLGEGAEPLGTLVHVRLADQVDVLINDLRTQVYHPEAFTQMGIDLGRKRLIVVKSTFHFYSAFSDLSQQVIFCATPGRVNPDTQKIAYTQRTPNYWPKQDDPLGKPNCDP